MSNFTLEIFDDESPKCSFYTVRYLDAEFSETERFILKFREDERLKPSLMELMNLIVLAIGGKYGARDEFFRHERQAQALPPRPGLREITIVPNFPLRLYCLKLSDSCVVLFNGGEKTSATSQEGETSMAFYEANRVAGSILKAIQDRTIKLDENQKSIIDYYESEAITDILL